MKKALQLFLLVAVLMTAFTTSADAQRKKKKKKSSKTDDYFDDKGTFKDRLWIGADVGLQRYRPAIGINNTTVIGNGFYFSIAPMVGYKITENFSAGPRLEILYQGERYDLSPFSLSENTKINNVSYGPGAFARLKILNMYFLQMEYQKLGTEVAVDIEPGTSKVISERIWDDHYYIGGGYSSSLGLIGIQVSLLWDLSREFDSNQIPISYRLGLNYKF